MTRAKRKVEPQFELDAYLPFFLAHILHRYDSNMVAGLREHRLNNSSWRVLSTLDYRDGLTIKELSHFTVLERSFVSRIVMTLEQRDLVTRHISDEDRRNVRVWLTGAGSNVLSDIMLPVVETQITLALQNVNDFERKHLLTTLKKIMGNVYRAARELPPQL